MDDVVRALEIGVVQETLDEVSGRSRSRWGIALVAFLAGIALTLYVRHRRRQQARAQDLTTP
jgi:hypothetical protein